MTSNGHRDRPCCCSGTCSSGPSRSGCWSSAPVGPARCPTTIPSLRWSATCDGRKILRRLTLQGLDDAGVEAFLEAATGQGLDDQGRALSMAMSVGTGGNPFFLGEVVRHLRESGRLVDTDGGWAGAWSATGDVPEGIRDVVRARVAKLSETAGQLLVLAAVTGDEFDLRTLAAAGDLTEDEGVAAIDEVIAAALVVELGPPPARCRFAHALVRASLYEQLSRHRRMQFHRRVGEALEMIHAGRLQEHLPELAYHFGRAAAGAGDVETAIRYHAQAGDAALDQLASDQAADYFRQALVLLERVTPSTESRSRRARSPLRARRGTAPRRLRGAPADPAGRRRRCAGTRRYGSPGASGAGQ